LAGCARSVDLGFPKTGKMIHRFGGSAIAHFNLQERGKPEAAINHAADKLAISSLEKVVSQFPFFDVRMADS